MAVTPRREDWVAPRIDPFTSATAIPAALCDGTISAAELLELPPAPHRAPQSRAQRRRRPQRRRGLARGGRRRRAARGGDGALLGLPHTLKGSIDVRGLRTTVGLPGSAQFVAAHDAPLAARVRAAGGVLLGKTNVPPLLMDCQSETQSSGAPTTPGTSAARPEAAPAAARPRSPPGFTPLQYGSDIGGSIRLPAAFCGVYGHKPSETALPRSNAAAVMGVQGPLARSAEDLDLTLAVAAGPDVGEDAAWCLELPPPRQARLADCRVAVLPPIEWLPVDDEISGALDGLARALATAGARVAEAQPEPFGDLRDHVRLYVSLLSAVGGTRLSDTARRERLGWYAARGDEFAAASVSGLQATVVDFFRWHAERERTAPPTGPSSASGTCCSRRSR